jgi:hypothetical protein
VTIRSYVHLLSDHVKAAHAVGWSLAEMEGVSKLLICYPV